MIRTAVREILGDDTCLRVAKLYWAMLRVARLTRLSMRSMRATIHFLFDQNISLRFSDRFRLLQQFREISQRVPCPHQGYEILSFVSHMLKIAPSKEGVFVEAGCFKGGSTAKFSLVAKLLDRRLFVFDSFEGLPENDENRDHTIYGQPISAFKEGAYCGALEEVKTNVSAYGDINVCTFIKGWFEDNLPTFKQPLLGVYIDVDLASSTRTCLKYLYPELVSGGVAISQDGHLPRVLEVIDDKDFWEREVGWPKPRIDGFGRSTIVTMHKDN